MSHRGLHDAQLARVHLKIWNQLEVTTIPNFSVSFVFWVAILEVVSSFSEFTVSEFRRCSLASGKSVFSNETVELQAQVYNHY